MKRFDLIIVGAGPSGLSAAIEAANRGMNVVVFDEKYIEKIQKIINSNI